MRPHPVSGTSISNGFRTGAERRCTPISTGHWLLSPKADGSPGTIRTEIESGRIVGKRADHATDFFSRKSPSEGTSQATEDSSHVSVGVSKLLFDCIHEK